MSSTPSENIISAEQQNGQESEIQKNLPKQSSLIAKLTRALVLVTSLAAGAVAIDGCVTPGATLKDRVFNAMAELVKESGYEFAGKTPDGGAMMCGEGGTFDEAKNKAIENIEAILGTSELEHRFISREIESENKWVVCVISKKKEVIPKTPDEGMEMLLRTYGHEFCGKTHDMIHGCGKGSSKEEAEKNAINNISLYKEEGKRYIHPFVKHLQLEDGTWVAVAQTFPKSNRPIKDDKSDSNGSSVILKQEDITIKRPKTPRDIINLTNIFVRRSRLAFQACHSRALKRDPDVEGKLIVEVEIGKNGRVRKSRVIRKESTLKNKIAESCVLSVTKGWRYPNQRQTQYAEISLHFRAPR